MTPGITWTAPGAEQIAPGVWRIPLPLPNNGLRAVNVYALADGDGVTLVDAGWALDEARAALCAALGALGLDLRDIRRFLVTQVHRDHYTQAVAIRREFGTRVLLGEGEKLAIERHAQPGYRALAAHLAMLARLGAKPVLAALHARRGPHGRDHPGLRAAGRVHRVG